MKWIAFILAETSAPKRPSRKDMAHHHPVAVAVGSQRIRLDLAANVPRVATTSDLI